MENIIPARTLNLTYIICDSIIMLIFLILLIIKKKRITLLWSLFGGILYFIVDYVFFYHVNHSRVVMINNENANEIVYFFYLLWHELSSGISNFAFIWICLNKNKDKDFKNYILLILLWWFVPGAISIIDTNKNISCYRTTTSYHYVMAIFLFIGYLGLIIYNLFNKKGEKINIFYLLLVGISVQFLWESALLIFNIRPYNENSFQTLIIDSLLETNLGLPYIYLIYRFVYKYLNEDLSKVERLKNENN